MKHENRKPGTRKGFAALVALVLILCVTIGGTIAWITAQTPAVTNRFEPAKVTSWVDETFDGSKKENVAIENRGDIPAYIRAKVVYNWADSNGNVYAQPVTSADYTIVQGSAKWELIDGYYYYKEAVGVGSKTENLIKSITPDEDAAPEGYKLQVTILAEAIQSTPADAIKEAWKVNPDGWTQIS